MKNIDELKKNVAEKISVTNEELDKIIEKAIIGGEIVAEDKIGEWLEERLAPNCVLIDEDGYAKMCVDALKILGTTAATDYGSSRQRDLGQLWADMTRGYLGEFAFTLFLNDKFGISSKLGHEVGTLQENLPMDVHQIRETGKEYRKPKVQISLKTTKWNGIWLDIPGDQFNHSDVHVLVKVGAGRDHLFAFFKNISVFKDKILKRGKDVGSLSSDEAQSLYDHLPSFRKIPAYICGFALKNNSYTSLPYSGKKGRLHYMISSWNGAILPGDLEKIKQKEKLGVSGKVRFEGIGEFAHDKGYLFNAGSLLWKKEDWNKVISLL